MPPSEANSNGTVFSATAASGEMWFDEGPRRVHSKNRTPANERPPRRSFFDISVVGGVDWESMNVVKGQLATERLPAGIQWDPFAVANPIEV